jgi:hypothetical protein
MRPVSKKIMRAVNSGRRALGMKPLKRLPKGNPLQADSCPLAAAFQSPAVDTYIEVENTEAARKLANTWHTGYHEYEHEVLLPDVLQKFVEDFDHFEYPQLIIK